MKVWEVTHRDYNGESDGTDHLVFWVVGEYKDVKKAINKDNRAKLWSQVDAGEEDVDFTLPNDYQALKGVLA